ncbi:MAG: 2-amino-4-hydroxy-6-hydroxymethyldihydropteridine diphosphokinase [Methylomicrobium sp.]|nr:2-amino-4-hydroxy-6-hydroxymethyldihydropteridine diphosphokinase [Methylomicrobium sp.]
MINNNDFVTAFIGLGSNLDQPAEQLMTARQTLAALPNIKETGFSSLYRNPPMGPQDQPDYINAVMAIETSLPAIDLLRQLQAVEQSQGRIRTGERWGARTLDLDLLLYGDRQIEVPDLTVPHIGIAERAFVLYPLYEIAPDLSIPGLGKLTDLIAKCPKNDLHRLT